jgi:putative intracellular protease/amidase
VITLSRPNVLVLFALVFALVSAAFAAGAFAAGKRYVCPPCASPCDTTVYDAPGVCLACGMPLVETGAAAAAAKAPADPNQKKVAILVFDGVEILDYTGPWEMFGAAGCDVYMVAATKNPVTTAMGMTIVPNYTFADAPPPDVLVIPGGGVYGASRSEPTLRYIRDTSPRTAITMSVCNGAFILANTGLLDGLSATTTYHNIPRLAKEYPKIKVVSNQRYVDNGKIVTAAGLSAGMDGALHVIARLFGTGYAQEVALGEEYDWKTSGSFARAALADHQIPPVELDTFGKWETVRTEGTTERWEIVTSGRSDLATAEVMERIEQALAKGKWTKVTASSATQASRASTWRFTGTDGKPWTGTLKLEAGKSDAHQCTAALSIARAG